MKLRTKRPPVFNQRQAAWDHVLASMEEQLLTLPAHLADRAPEIRKFIRLAERARESVRDSTAGVTIESDKGNRFVVVWVSAFGRERPVASLVLPVSKLWMAAQERYLEIVISIPDERDRMIEEDEWL